jgi:lipoprotein signal peptidase
VPVLRGCPRRNALRRGTASKIGGGLLFAFAAYIVAGAAWSFWTQHGEAFSFLGVIVALLAIPIMTLLA